MLPLTVIDVRSAGETLPMNERTADTIRRPAEGRRPAVPVPTFLSSAAAMTWRTSSRGERGPI